MAAAGINLKLQKFDGRDGPLQALEFLQDAQDILQVLNIPDANKVAFILTHFESKSPAHMWSTNTRRLLPDAFKKLTPFLKLFMNEFCQALTLAECNAAKRKLKLKEGETVKAFYQRVQFFLHSKDFHRSDEFRSTEGYQAAFEENLKNIFVEGLPSSVVDQLAFLDINNVAAEDLLQAVLRATRNRHVGQPAQSSTVNAFQHRPPSRPSFQPSRSQQARPSNNARARRPYPTLTSEQLAYRRANKPSPGVLRGRQKLTCDRCGLMAKHRARECFLPLDASGRPMQTPRPQRAQRAINEVAANNDDALRGHVTTTHDDEPSPPPTVNAIQDEPGPSFDAYGDPLSLDQLSLNELTG